MHVVALNFQAYFDRDLFFFTCNIQQYINISIFLFFLKKSANNRRREEAAPRSYVVCSTINCNEVSDGIY